MTKIHATTLLFISLLVATVSTATTTSSGSQTFQENSSSRESVTTDSVSVDSSVPASVDSDDTLTLTDDTELVTVEEDVLDQNDTDDDAASVFSSAYIKEQIELRRQECAALHEGSVTPTDGSFCPPIFDGWSCFNATEAGGVAPVQCPGFIVGFDSTRYGEKICLENGTWFTHPESGHTWTNYTNCVNLNDLELHQLVNKVYIIGYSVSLITLSISLTIFFSFKSLKCTRVSIHKNLFASFLINNILWLVWSTLVVSPDTQVLQNNQFGCQFLHVLAHYFLVSTYFWMLCEGLYLHTLLVVTFVAESKLLKYFLLLGWVLPLPFITLYAAFRSHSENMTKHCWMEESDFNYFLSIPVVLSMFLNFAFLVNIVRVLVTKLRAANTSPDQNSTRKAVRATLILVPLLGLHYLLTPFRPPEDSPMTPYYLILSAIATSFQGFAVSLLFCFFNGEVLAVLKKKWRQNRMMRAPQHYATAAYSYKASMADGLTQVTTYNAGGDGDDL